MFGRLTDTLLRPSRERRLTQARLDVKDYERLERTARSTPGVSPFEKRYFAIQLERCRKRVDELDAKLART